MKEIRSMEQAICDEVAGMRQRGVSEKDAREKWHHYDESYRYTVNHKTRRGAVDLYILREACERYMRDEFGAEV